mgnify:CR=1 FL=1
MLIRLASNLLGFSILVAMIVGGGTQAGLLSDTVVKLVLAFSSTFAILANRRAVLTPVSLIFPLATLLIFALQLTPLPIAFVKSYWDPSIREAWDAAGSLSSFGVLTTSVNSTLHMLSEAATAILFFWACLNVDSADAPRLAQFFAVGWVVHLVAGLIEFATTNFATISTALPYPINAGLFANSNHFGLLMAIGIPPLIFFLVKQRSPFSGALIALIYLLLFAVGSRSALAIALFLTLVSLIAAGGSWRRVLGFVALVSAALAALYFSGILFGFLFKYQDAPVARLEIASTTLQAIKNSPIFGTGFGTFLQIYPIYESPPKISHEYVNRAHNDFLEAVLEGGAPVALLICAYFAFLAWLGWRISRIRSMHLRDTATFAIFALIAILLQSAVDYPLRTWALLAVFLYANASAIDAVMHVEQARAARDLKKPAPEVSTVVPLLTHLGSWDSADRPT